MASTTMAPNDTQGRCLDPAAVEAAIERLLQHPYEQELKRLRHENAALKSSLGAVQAADDSEIARLWSCIEELEVRLAVARQQQQQQQQRHQESDGASTEAATALQQQLAEAAQQLQAANQQLVQLGTALGLPAPQQVQPAPLPGPVTSMPLMPEAGAEAGQAEWDAELESHVGSCLAGAVAEFVVPQLQAEVAACLRLAALAPQAPGIGPQQRMALQPATLAAAAIARPAAMAWAAEQQKPQAELPQLAVQPVGPHDVQQQQVAPGRKEQHSGPPATAAAAVGRGEEQAIAAPRSGNSAQQPRPAAVTAATGGGSAAEQQAQQLVERATAQKPRRAGEGLGAASSLQDGAARKRRAESPAAAEPGGRKRQRRELAEVRPPQQEDQQQRGKKQRWQRQRRQDQQQQQRATQDSGEWRGQRSSERPQAAAASPTQAPAKSAVPAHPAPDLIPRVGSPGPAAGRSPDPSRNKRARSAAPSKAQQQAGAEPAGAAAAPLAPASRGPQPSPSKPAASDAAAKQRPAAEPVVAAAAAPLVMASRAPEPSPSKPAASKAASKKRPAAEPTMAAAAMAAPVATASHNSQPERRKAAASEAAAKQRPVAEPAAAAAPASRAPQPRKPAASEAAATKRPGAQPAAAAAPASCNSQPRINKPQAASPPAKAQPSGAAQAAPAQQHPAPAAAAAPDSKPGSRAGSPGHLGWKERCAKRSQRFGVPTPPEGAVGAAGAGHGLAAPGEPEEQELEQGHQEQARQRQGEQQWERQGEQRSRRQRQEPSLQPKEAVAGRRVVMDDEEDGINEQLGGVIFICNNSTIKECQSGLVFGLPQHHWYYVQRIRKGMPIFLFNFSDRRLHGIYHAASAGGWEINPKGWAPAGKRTSYPSQVRVQEGRACSSISERDFRHVLTYQGNSDKFKLDLTREQAAELCALFKPQQQGSRPARG